MSLSRTRMSAFALVAGLALVSGGPTYAKDGTPPPPKAQINAPGLRALVRSRVPLTIVDARSNPRELIPNARIVYSRTSSVNVQRLLPNRSALIVIYDDGPTTPDTRVLADRLDQGRYTSVIRFTGGLAAWKKAGYNFMKVAPPTPKAAPPPYVAPPVNPNPPRGSGSRGSGSR